MDEKLEELETRLAFQDQELQTLNDVIINQQSQIDGLEEKIRLLHEKMKDLKTETVIPASEETPPPHY